ncbi:type II toxin-antitoxin system Phd/YefM family antitoxin [Gracilimonas mengyeensis]|uniref:Antitoxin n=1 Tax=Gracilimonas mengyeensis TaxID=1302730 RepID=A0A521B8C4_9BACT|nr:type II toxin-antitoxin system Phd/YefM family antitoxin [Gracilimonas mengyeensis]SMO43364.1 prevent-host-death family protein [Gracilimonas mengyeensis]
MDVKTVNSASARKSFSELLNESGYGGKRIVVTRKGKAIAAMVSIQDLEAIQALEDNKDASEAKRILEDAESEFIPWEQAKKELS